MKTIMEHAFPKDGNSENAFPKNAVEYKCIFLVDSSLAGLMIGKNGERISSIRKTYNVQVYLQKPPDGQYDEEVTFQGTLEDVENSVNELNDVFRIFFHE